MAVTPPDDAPELTTWITEGGVEVVDFDGDGPWWLVWLERLGLHRTFWFRGDPQRVMAAAREADVRRVAITPSDRLNEFFTVEE